MRKSGPRPNPYCSLGAGLLGFEGLTGGMFSSIPVMQKRASSAGRPLSTGGLLTLSLIWAWASLRIDLLPGNSTALHFPPLIAQALPLGLFAILAGLIALIGRGGWPTSKELSTAVSVGLGLFVVPAFLTAWSNEWIGPSTKVALFSLTPVFAVVLEPYLGDEDAPQLGHAFAAALIAVAGTLLVFSIDIPRSPTSGLAFLGVIVASASVAAANCIGVRVLPSASTGPSLSFAAVATASAATVLGAVGAVVRPQNGTTVPLDAWSALDLVSLILLFWLMTRMSAVRMTARFLIAPLLANLIAIAFLRPAIDARGWAGLALIAIGSGWLLLTRENEPEITARPHESVNHPD